MVPEGVTTTRSWLMEAGLTRHALDNLVKSDQLESIVNGVYKKSGSTVSWQGILYYLQYMEKTNLTIGGITALEMQGLAHYLPLGKQKSIHLYGDHKFPNWVNALVPDVEFIYHGIKDLLGKQRVYEGKNTMPGHQEDLLTFTMNQQWKEGLPGLRMSIPERAYLEVLMDVPNKISFDHADQLILGLTSLSPRKLQKLLTLCENVKVRRLFFWIAERYNYSWLSRIDRSNLGMGTGNRVIAKGGKLNKKYQITVPEIYE